VGDVFISYSHTDSGTADKIAAVLDDLSITYFRDVKDIDWGDAITPSVREGLDRALAVIVILSPGSLKSHWVSYEVGYSVGRGKRLLPFLTHPALDPPGFIADLSHAKTIDEVKQYFESNRDWATQQDIALPSYEAASDTAAFKRLAGMMPGLFEEMKEDLSSEGSEVVREFVPLGKEGIRFNHGGKARFEYYGDVHPQLRNRVDILEDHGFVRVVRVGKYTKIYRMTEEFVSLLVSWQPGT